MDAGGFWDIADLRPGRAHLLPLSFAGRNFSAQPGQPLALRMRSRHSGVAMVVDCLETVVLQPDSRYGVGNTCGIRKLAGGERRRAREHGGRFARSGRMTAAHCRNAKRFGWTLLEQHPGKFCSSHTSSKAHIFKGT